MSGNQEREFTKLMLIQHEKLVPDLFQSILKSVKSLMKQKGLEKDSDSESDLENEAEATLSSKGSCSDCYFWEPQSLNKFHILRTY